MKGIWRTILAGRQIPTNAMVSQIVDLRILRGGRDSGKVKKKPWFFQAQHVTPPNVPLDEFDRIFQAESCLRELSEQFPV